jgi:hypothetical protein
MRHAPILTRGSASRCFCGQPGRATSLEIDPAADLDLERDTPLASLPLAPEGRAVATRCRCGGRLVEEDEDGRVICLHCRRTVRMA